MYIEGELRKMPVSIHEDGEVQYRMRFYDSVSGKTKEIPLNEAVGKKIQVHFMGNIFCKRCGKKTPKSYNQGFCYTCFRTAPESAECIIRPELCRAHLGEGRDPEWEEKHHNQPHIVYLAATDVIKVGVTRATQIPTRWIDQGASSAIKFAETPNRYQAGLMEVALKSQFTDKTNWRKMLKNEVDGTIDLEETKWEVEDQLPMDMRAFVSPDDTLTAFRYPVLEYPTKISSLKLDKQPDLSGELMGIKGQYLLLDGNRVMNIRSHAGYQVTWSIEN